MKPNRLLSIVALAALTVTACDKSSQTRADVDRQLQEARDRETALRNELDSQKLAAERDAIETERQRIEDAKAGLARMDAERASAEAEKLRQREEALATRESSLSDREASVAGREQLLNDHELDLAGREPLPELDPTPDLTDPEPVSDYNVFYDQLSSDGSWFETPDYGYVWQPTVVIQDASWRPYTRGRWACSNRGWTWVSDESFGWATYHYGRWADCRGRGWVWVPGDEWAPSWVCWRSGDSHIGWAPLPPESMGFRRRGWGSSVETDLGISASWFSFVAINDFGGPLRSRCLPVSQNQQWWGRTKNITNITFQNNQFNMGGPGYREINRQLGKPMPFYELNLDRYDGARPGRMRSRIEGDRLNVFAPLVNANWNAGLKPQKVKDTWRDVQIDRQQNLKGEFADRFRQTQMDRQKRAEDAIAQMGGQQGLQRERTAIFERNRRDQQSQAQGIFAEKQKEIQQRQKEAFEKLRGEAKNDPVKLQQIDQRERVSEQQDKLRQETGNRMGGRPPVGMPDDGGRRQPNEAPDRRGRTSVPNDPTAGAAAGQQGQPSQSDQPRRSSGRPPVPGGAISGGAEPPPLNRVPESNELGQRGRRQDGSVPDTRMPSRVNEANPPDGRQAQSNQPPQPNAGDVANQLRERQEQARQAALQRQQESANQLREQQEQQQAAQTQREAARQQQMQDRSAQVNEAAARQREQMENARQQIQDAQQQQAEKAAERQRQAQEQAQQLAQQRAQQAELAKQQQADRMKEAQERALQQQQQLRDQQERAQQQQQERARQMQDQQEQARAAREQARAALEQQQQERARQMQEQQERARAAQEQQQQERARQAEEQRKAADDQQRQKQGR